MIISRTPLRITLGGGGSDDPRYVQEHGGFAVTAAINKHVYVGINTVFSGGYTLKYSRIEHADTLADIHHPILRECIRFFDLQPGVEIVSLADVPGGTGLGSSGAFTVGLCQTLDTLTKGAAFRTELAEMAAHVELNLLGRPGGKQDHWATALGGLQALTFCQDGTVRSDPVNASATNLSHLESHLQLYFTGLARSAHDILSTQTTDGLDFIKASGYTARDLIVAGDVDGLGELMHQHWLAKRGRSKAMSNDHIDRCYEVAIRNGAVGGKLVGAGGGGFLLFVTNDGEQLTAAMATEGLQEMRFGFDHGGCSIIANTE